MPLEFLGTCVNIFDEDGYCTFPHLYRDTSDCAVHIDNAEDITYNEFIRVVGAIPQLVSDEISEDTIYLHDSIGNYIIYDIQSDIHYFFK